MKKVAMAKDEKDKVVPTEKKKTKNNTTDSQNLFL